MEDSTGPHGIPYTDALDPDNDGWYEVETKVDHAQAALDQWQKGDGTKADPGTLPYVINTRPKGASWR